MDRGCYGVLCDYACVMQTFQPLNLRRSTTAAMCHSLVLHFPYICDVNPHTTSSTYLCRALSSPFWLWSHSHYSRDVPSALNSVCVWCDCMPVDVLMTQSCAKLITATVGKYCTDSTDNSNSTQKKTSKLRINVSKILVSLSSWTEINFWQCADYSVQCTYERTIYIIEQLNLNINFHQVTRQEISSKIVGFIPESPANAKVI